ncbi:hypothetical protein C8N42_11392 [Celeribacter persicus]|uniref:Uncharacterized protein n=1 Tax=Celeribacter persicus TaxID=1651082 RepID=A0A2T5HBK0_9RHOB|nr:hypothetical protein C8N42_11392 [Celeribacter persicus]
MPPKRPKTSDHIKRFIIKITGYDPKIFRVVIAFLKLWFTVAIGIFICAGIIYLVSAFLAFLR